jgi:hypothetical protein
MTILLLRWLMLWRRKHKHQHQHQYHHHALSPSVEVVWFCCEAVLFCTNSSTVHEEVKKKKK